MKEETKKRWRRHLALLARAVYYMLGVSVIAAIGQQFNAELSNREAFLLSAAGFAIVQIADLTNRLNAMTRRVEAEGGAG